LDFNIWDVSFNVGPGDSQIGIPLKVINWWYDSLWHTKM